MALTFCAVVLFGSDGLLNAETIAIPGSSFESPITPFADPRIDFWQKTPKPDWYDESGGNLWDQLTGVFMNTAPTNSDHIDNCDGNQALFLFALPQVGIFQDHDSTDWSNSVPTHAFDAKFEVGKAYTLTVGVIGGGGGMLEGVSLQAALYYRDAASNMVAVAATNIVHSQTLFPNATHFVDCVARVPTVTTNDAWAGANIGVSLMSSIIDPNLAGGYWDLDNVRLTATEEPTGTETVLLSPTWDNGQFTLIIQSQPGLKFEILASPDLAAPVSSWTQIGTVTNSSGTASFVDASAASSQRFYRANQLQ